MKFKIKIVNLVTFAKLAACTHITYVMQQILLCIRACTTTFRCKRIHVVQKNVNCVTASLRRNNVYVDGCRFIEESNVRRLDDRSGLVVSTP